MRNQPQTENDQWTILKLVNWTDQYFQSHNIEGPRSSAEILLAHVLKCRRIDLYLKYDKPLLLHELAEFKKLIKRRVKNEPAAYITGTKQFRSIEVSVTKDVLIPRPETELLVQAAADILKVSDLSRSMLELGTGSGALIISVASEIPNLICFAGDISQKAVSTAKKNAKKNNLAHKIEFFCGNWFSSLKQTGFDIIISNPPYIKSSEIKNIMPEVSLYEPKTALDGGCGGLDHIKKIITQAHNYLKQEGRLILEIGYDQKQAVQEITNSSGYYKQIEFIRDYAGYDSIALITA